MSGHRQESFLNRKKVYVCYGLAFLATLGYGIMIPSLSVHAHSMGANHGTIGMIVSAFAAAQLLTQIPMGRLSDRVGRVYLMVAGFLLISVAATLYNFATHSDHFFFLQALAGVGGGCLWPPLMAILNEDVDPLERGRLMGTFNTVFFLGVGMGPLIGGVIANAFGAPAVFNTWGVIAFVGAIVCMIALWETAKDKKATAARRALASQRDIPLIRPGMLGTFAASCVVRSRGGVCSSFNNALLPLYAVSLFDATPAMIGSIMFIHGIGLAFFNLPGGVVTDKYGRRMPAVVGSLVASAGVLWYSAANGYWALFAAVGFAGAGSAFSTPAISALCADVSDPRRRGEAFGYSLTSFNLGMVFGGLIFGFVAQFVGLWGAVFTWGVTSLTLSLFGFLIKEPVPEHQQAKEEMAVQRG
jgi:MFS family permease